VYDPKNVDCVEEQDPCTYSCESGGNRNYRVSAVAVHKGKACRGPTDCQLGDGYCREAKNRVGGNGTADDGGDDNSTADGDDDEQGRAVAVKSGKPVTVVIVLLLILACIIVGFVYVRRKEGAKEAAAAAAAALAELGDASTTEMIMNPLRRPTNPQMPFTATDENSSSPNYSVVGMSRGDAVPNPTYSCSDIDGSGGGSGGSEQQDAASYYTTSDLVPAVSNPTYSCSDIDGSGGGGGGGSEQQDAASYYSTSDLVLASPEYMSPTTSLSATNSMYTVINQAFDAPNADNMYQQAPRPFSVLSDGSLATTHIADGDVYDEAGYGASDAQYDQQRQRQRQQQHDAIHTTAGDPSEDTYDGPAYMTNSNAASSSDGPIYAIPVEGGSGAVIVQAHSAAAGHVDDDARYSSYEAPADAFADGGSTAPLYAIPDESETGIQQMKPFKFKIPSAGGGEANEETDQDGYLVITDEERRFARRSSMA